MSTTSCDRPRICSLGLRPRLAAHWQFKLVAGATLLIAFFALYFLAQQTPLARATPMPRTAVDVALGFHPRAVFLYASLWLYIPIAPWLLASSAELRAYCQALILVCGAGLAAFFLWPTRVPAPTGSGVEHPAYRVLAALDGRGNACPSLHAALAVFSAACLHHLLNALGAPRGLRLLNWAWGAAILYATLATKQHVVLDVAAGALLGLAGVAVYFRSLSGPTEAGA